MQNSTFGIPFGVPLHSPVDGNSLLTADAAVIAGRVTILILFDQAAEGAFLAICGFAVLAATISVIVWISLFGLKEYTENRGTWKNYWSLIERGN